MNDGLDPELRALLGIQPPASRDLDAARIHQLLTRQPFGYLGYLQRELAAVARGQLPVLSPPRQTFSDPKASGDFRVMPTVVGRYPRARKTVSVLGSHAGRAGQGANAVVGRTLLLDPVANGVVASFDAGALASARAGATAALAVALLEGGHDQALVLGAGRVGFYAALYLAARGAARRIVLADAQPGRARRAAEYLSRWYPEVGLEAGDLRELAQEWSFVVTATDSREPVYQARRNPAPVVVSLGADTAWRRELPLSLAGAWPVYVDSVDALRTGDLKHWRSRGLMRPGDLVDLVALVREGSKPPGEDPVVFVATGSPLLDNLTVGYLMQALEADEASA